MLTNYMKSTKLSPAQTYQLKELYKNEKGSEGICYICTKATKFKRLDTHLKAHHSGYAKILDSIKK